MSESDVYSCQILTYKDGPSAERFKISQVIQAVLNKIRPCFVENMCGSSALYVLKNSCLGSAVGDIVDFEPSNIGLNPNYYD